ncbi:phosphoribosylaminoimidazolecarboxamide formyltransferase [uncultured Phascolarctobacterium sp.]|uniref:phosphoribosylaminoimidazolecarboxamide formyltransferase n=1 Tax=uncultured Phascolarctobacterium sp. TaxID=512296 RepID=UPI003428A510
MVVKELQLKYGCNPNQSTARIYTKTGELPIEVLNGRPGYINFLDAFNSWQLVKELKEATGLPAAASFKHVSPAGAAVGLPMSDVLKKIYYVDDLELTPLATAYARARGADRMSSYGDFVALSDICDKETATMLAREVSDGVIAPGYTDEALEILKTKRKGTYNVIKIDPAYVPELKETKDVFGITFEQDRNEVKITAELLVERPTANKEIPENAVRDLLISLITLKYTQSNSVCYVKDGQAIGIGAGQQSRVHCTRLAGNKADIWWLRQNPKALALPFKDSIRRPDRDNTIDVYISDDCEDVLAEGIWQQFFTEKPEPLTRAEKTAWLTELHGVSLGSDAFFPFGDNIERAHRSGVDYIAQAGGSIRDDNVIDTCDKYNIAMAFTGLRLFHH